MKEKMKRTTHTYFSNDPKVRIDGDGVELILLTKVICTCLIQKCTIMPYLHEASITCGAAVIFSVRVSLVTVHPNVCVFNTTFRHSKSSLCFAVIYRH